MKALRYSRLSRYKIKKIIECFGEDITATSASKILRINRNTVSNYYNLFRKLIFEHSLAEEKKQSGEFKLDESYFGAVEFEASEVEELPEKHRFSAF